MYILGFLNKFMSCELWDEMGRIMATIVDKMMIHIDKPSACQMPHVILSRQTQDGDMANQSSH